jgi:hypothetical protein
MGPQAAEPAAPPSARAPRAAQALVAGEQVIPSRVAAAAGPVAARLLPGTVLTGLAAALPAPAEGRVPTALVLTLGQNDAGALGGRPASRNQGRSAGAPEASPLAPPTACCRPPGAQQARPPSPTPPPKHPR